MPPSTPSPSSTRDSRERLLDTAEQLMAERGVDAVSLREINTAAGQRNASGLQYHFGNRNGLVAALVERHMHEIDEQRNRLVDALEASGRTGDVHAMVGALVTPLAGRLTTASGRRYLRIIHELADRHLPAGDDLAPAELNRSLRRSVRHLDAAIDELPPRLRAERSAQITSFLLQALADQARRDDVRNAKRRLRDDAFAANLIDVLVAVLTAPVSRTTKRLAT